MEAVIQSIASYGTFISSFPDINDTSQLKNVDLIFDWLQTLTSFDPAILRMMLKNQERTAELIRVRYITFN